MDRILAKLERKLGQFSTPHLTAAIVAGMGVMFMLLYVKPEFMQVVTLDVDRVLHGEVWRLVSYLFIPRTMSLFWLIFSLSFTYMIGTGLEAEWGDFKFNVFYMLGMLGTTIAAVITGGGVGNQYIHASLFFAFATLWPDYEISLFVIQVKVKWLALLSAIGMAFEIVAGDWTTRAAIMAALANYFLFFGGQIWRMFRERNLRVRQAARRASMSPEGPVVTSGRVCAICGAKESDDVDIRVCTCAKCAPSRTLCLEHARNH